MSACIDSTRRYVEGAMNENEEWDQIAKKGAAARRKKLVPVLAGLGAFAIVFVTVFFAVGSVWAKSAQADEDAKQARLARGERVYEWHARGSTKESRAAGDGLVLFLIATGAGVGAAAGAFFALGGKLSAEYQRGFEAMRR